MYQKIIKYFRKNLTRRWKRYPENWYWWKKKKKTQMKANTYSARGLRAKKTEPSFHNINVMSVTVRFHTYVESQNQIIGNEWANQTKQKHADAEKSIVVIRRERVSGEVKLIMVTDGNQSFGSEHTEGYTETEVSCTNEI